jgi:hypothetical protein
MREAGHIFSSREQPGVSGHSSQRESVFILHFALNDTVAEGAAGLGLACP